MRAGDNILPHLAADVAKLHQEAEGHEKQAVAKALDAGRKLNEAKAMIRHGGWGNWLATTGIGERKAQRYMHLDRYALNSDTVTDLGGIAAALEWLAPVKLPPAGSILIASADGFEPGGSDLMGFVWPHGKGYHVAMLDLRPEWPHHKKTKEALIPTKEMGERLVWLTLWLSCDWRCPELSFVTADAETQVQMMIELASGADGILERAGQ